ncbi:MAG: NAD(P)/FAD-dependent oxidoreductase [Anaerolineae bacterium]|nr:NAD(P)/FAD-dependent oxidoreductase [Anaerolineae bacterium]
MKPVYDLIVVGAGPGGCTAARLAAEGGLDVLLIEKHQEIGSPVRCGEAVGLDSLRAFIEPDDRWINARVNCYTVYNAVGDSVNLPPTEPTLILDRKIFDRELAHRAAQAGASVYAKTSAVGVLHDNEYIVGVQIDHQGQLREIHSKLVIAADGTESQVARWAGLSTVPALVDYYIGVEFLLSLRGQTINPTVCQYHLDPSTAPGGYAWVFPKGRDMANVGLVISADRANNVRAQTCLQRFVERHFPEAGVLSEISGGIPITGALKRLAVNGLMVIGDAAHQADPLTAGGINLAMIAADMAAQVAVKAVRSGDVSIKTLCEYESAWHNRFDKQHKALYKIRKILLAMDEETLNTLVKTASELRLDEMTLKQILLTLFRSHPHLLLETATLITTGLILK